ncbi:hypothetical protein DDE18_15930 [Nocardioides gansuensis]|uniref:Uncharacterized protein n=1 Tax=Nocardioides gansuensis TaxID=2138300 RepID=A0A2T8F709_9ACTN|nr:hypothetical protein DDE18_15930 [Nocardioides gansuensis]
MSIVAGACWLARSGDDVRRWFCRGGTSRSTGAVSMSIEFLAPSFPVIEGDTAVGVAELGEDFVP